MSESGFDTSLSTFISSWHPFTDRLVDASVSFAERSSIMDDSLHFETQNVADFKVFKVDDLLPQMRAVIAEVAAITGIPDTICRILLGQYRWSKETLLESFYDAEDGESFLRKRKIFLPLDTDATLKTEQGICEICYEELQVSSLSCKHTFCSDCWSQYLETRIGSDAKDQVSCPGAGCQMYLDDEVVLSFLSRKRELAVKYHRIILDSFVQSNSCLRWCPAANCTYVVQSEEGNGSGVTCNCGKTFCFKCSSDWHGPLTCLHLKMWTKKCNDDSETSNWMNANTKDCPKCHGVIEKNGGCNHITCKNMACSYEFCWVCLGPWSEHGTSYYSCNRYDSSSSKDARAKESNARELLTRYVFYYTRFNNHRQSTVIKQKLSDSLQHRMEYMQTYRHVSFIDMQYVKRAFQVMYESREVLMYTYPFAYYLDQACNITKIFEQNQRDLEQATEILGELLERRFMKEDDANLEDLKHEVINKTNYVDQRMKALLKHCQEGYDQCAWKFHER
ncbi:hypothetical protein L596_023714 [Steinernema carpocapsae]|uniref:RBR-type E3 ubiquitin transferase n=1 Tax=Steinernema carpocapsae TaxID=34508 RepID=A0A4U5MF89_STECR|nr:hypothetical protein L596_023714 [Steinernema carpocapsae]